MAHVISHGDARYETSFSTINDEKKLWKWPHNFLFIARKTHSSFLATKHAYVYQTFQPRAISHLFCPPWKRKSAVDKKMNSLSTSYLLLLAPQDKANPYKYNAHLQTPSYYNIDPISFLPQIAFLKTQKRCLWLAMVLLKRMWWEICTRRSWRRKKKKNGPSWARLHLKQQQSPVVVSSGRFWRKYIQAILKGLVQPKLHMLRLRINKFDCSVPISLMLLSSRYFKWMYINSFHWIG